MLSFSCILLAAGNDCLYANRFVVVCLERSTATESYREIEQFLLQQKIKLLLSKTIIIIKKQTHLF